MTSSGAPATSNASAASYDQRERAELCDLFERVGPDAPTLCEGWATRDLAAHLALRERRPDAGPGIVLGPLRGYAERVQRDLARKPWPELVEMVRTGPPRWSLYAVPGVGRVANTVEYFVHHEDVRRAQPGWEPRVLDPAFSAELWRALTRSRRLLFRRAPVGVVLRTPDGVVMRARPGDPAAVVEGPAQELLIYGFGRTGHARVRIDGDEATVEAFTDSRPGI